MQAQRILIVDDNEPNRGILEARLTGHGYEVLHAGDGEEALAAAKEHRPDLILLDVMMPKIDGIEVCRRLKSDPAMSFVPIILVTAKAESNDVVEGLDAGADEYLTKPIDQKALVARVKALLRLKAQHEASRERATPKVPGATDLFLSYSRQVTAKISPRRHPATSGLVGMVGQGDQGRLVRPGDRAGAHQRTSGDRGVVQHSVKRLGAGRSGACAREQTSDPVDKVPLPLRSFRAHHRSQAGPGLAPIIVRNWLPSSMICSGKPNGR